MKKLVLISVSAVLLTFFLAFNYLLWDKDRNTKSIESLENSNDFKEATINALGREIKSLEDTNSQLNTRIRILEDSQRTLKEKNSELDKQMFNLGQELQKRNHTIDAIKQVIDLSSFTEVINKWVENINNGQYEKAYSLMDIKAGAGKTAMSQEEFADSYKDTVKSIKFQTVELYNGEIPQGKEGDIILTVTLNVEKTEDANKIHYDEGTNTRFFTMEYRKDRDSWIISSIDEKI